MNKLDESRTLVPDTTAVDTDANAAYLSAALMRQVHVLLRAALRAFTYMSTDHAPVLYSIPYQVLLIMILLKHYCSSIININSIRKTCVRSLAVRIRRTRSVPVRMERRPQNIIRFFWV